MADDDASEKTQDPTQKRLDEALERGDVVKSQEVNTWFVMAGAALVAAAFSTNIAGGLQMPLRNLLANAHLVRTDGPGLLALMKNIDMMLVGVLGLPFLILVLAALAGNLVQHRLVWSSEPLSPKLSKLSPMAGAKRLFGKQAAMNFLKGLVKLVALGAIMAAILWPERHRVEALMRLDPVQILSAAQAMSMQLIGAVVALLAAIAAADYFFQYRTWFERQKMSREEIKEEYKQSEGDPHVKGRIKQLRVMRMKRRMMAAVPTASVVITNPTHFAVALKYEQGMTAPVCVAKGADAIAFKIREVAKANEIPIVENPPLARALHATVDIDDEIPVEHYQAVAEVIGYVMQLKRSFAGARR